MRVQWLHFDLGDQELELELNAFTIIGVADADARDQLCSAMARTLSHAEAGTSVKATLDDGSCVNSPRGRHVPGNRHRGNRAEQALRVAGKW